MAKGTARQQYRAGTLALGKTLKQARMGEFRASSDALGTLFGNLGTTQRGVARTLTSSNARKLAALSKLEKRTTRQTNGAVSGAAASAAHLFGGVAAAGQGYLFDQAAGHAKGAQTTQAGLTKAGGVISRGATEALGIEQAGAAEARAGADAQLAEALRYRAKNDAQLIADRQNILLQSKLDYENWKKQQEYLKAQEDASGGSAGGMSVVAESTGVASAHMRSYLMTNPDATPQEVVEWYQSKYGALDQNELVVMGSLAKVLVNRDISTRDEEVDAIMDSMLTLYPNFAGNKDAIRAAIEAQLKASYGRAGVSPPAGSAGVGSDGAPAQSPAGDSPPPGSQHGHWQLVQAGNRGGTKAYYIWVETQDPNEASGTTPTTSTVSPRGVTSHD